MTMQPKGPYVQAALFCDRLLMEQDNVITIVRMIDQVTRTAQGPDAPENMEPFEHQLVGLIALKAGDARGRQNFVVVGEKPDGIRRQLVEGSVNFVGGQHGGANVRLNINVRFEQEGLYWFEFVLEGVLLTKMPFLVSYQRIVNG